MIVYSVNNRFFDKKADADQLRKERGLKPADTHKIAINNREELAAFLDGLFQYALPDNNVQTDQQRPAAAEYVPDPDQAPSYIPEFIKRDWEKRRQYRQQG